MACCNEAGLTINLGLQTLCFLVILVTGNSLHVTKLITLGSGAVSNYEWLMPLFTVQWVPTGSDVVISHTQ